jgi:hypothetical protein
MLYREIIAVCSHIHTKHINTLCGQNVVLFNIKPAGMYSDHWALMFNEQICKVRDLDDNGHVAQKDVTINAGSKEL